MTNANCLYVIPVTVTVYDSGHALESDVMRLLFRNRKQKRQENNAIQGPLGTEQGEELEEPYYQQGEVTVTVTVTVTGYLFYQRILKEYEQPGT